MHRSKLAAAGKASAPWLLCAVATAPLLWAVRLLAARPQQRAGLDAAALLALIGREVLLACALALAVACSAALAAVLARALLLARPRLAERGENAALRQTCAAAVAALALGAAGAVLGHALAAGAWISAQQFAPLVRYGVAPVLGVAAFVFVFVQGARRSRAHDRPPPVIQTLALASVAAAASVADVRVLPGLYESAHAALTLLAVAAAVAALLPYARRWVAVIARGHVLVTCSLLVIAVLCVEGWAGASAATRIELAARGLAASGLELAATRAPRADLVRSELERLAREPAQAAVPANPQPAAPGGYPRGRDMNVLLIVIDALRGDALPPMRRAGPSVTPFLDEKLEQSVRFERAYTTATITTRAMPNLFGSTFAYREPFDPEQHVARCLTRAGRATIAIVTTWFTRDDDDLRAERAQIVGGFERVLDYSTARSDQAIDALDAALDGARAPFFAWLHYMNLHDPRYADPAHGALGSSRSGYDRALSWVDAQLRRVWQTLERRGLLDDTIVVLTSDHGEAFGEHGREFHGLTVFEEEVRVPLAFWVPGIAPRIAATTVSHLDLAPTLLDLAAGTAEPRHAGQTLVPLLLGHDTERARVAYMENVVGHLSAVVSAEQKLIHSELTGLLQRYDLARDPGETRDRHDPRSALDRRLLRALIANRPGLATRQARDSRTPGLLRRTLASPAAAYDGDRLRFALAVAGACGSDACLTPVRELRARTGDPRVALAADALLARAR